MAWGLQFQKKSPGDPMRRTNDTHLKKWALRQGLFYLATGLWPVLHLKSFEKVTGPKHDGWLVKTVGLLIACSGAAFVHAGMRRERLDTEIQWLAAGQALTLGTVSWVYSLKGRISKVYLLDTVAEYVLVSQWARQKR
jgi:hypothetical protein